ncbi:MAG: hypothetical protein HYV26_09730 [Candidatus Hydrogenedentes bacterium]|nr:hypothetical protein [Candidatus Hydrogenedentota bacterium]
MLTVGFATRCITPALGAFIPGLFEQRRATSVADDLWVRAVVIGTRGCKVALVQADTIALPEPVVAAARQQIQRSADIPEEHCMLAATHTHSGGPIGTLFTSPEDADYQKTVARAMAEAVIEADKRRRPCLLSTAVTSAPGVAFNRRFYMKDGSQVTHPGKMNPNIDRVAGPADPTLTTIGFRCAKTLQPLGAIVNFGCHATHMNGVAFSADYPYWVVKSLQAAYGADFGVVFLNAPSGDVTQVDNLSPRPMEFGPYWCERTGRAVGAAALLGLSTMDFRPRAGLDVAQSFIPVRMRRPTADAIKRARGPGRQAAPGAQDVEALYAAEALAVEQLIGELGGRDEKDEKDGKDRDSVGGLSVEVQLIRIADTLFWSVPGELFQKFALEVRARSYFPKTAGVTLANGYYGYICTPEAFAGGGYEVRLARSSFLAPDTGDRIVATATGLAKHLYDSAKRELRTQKETFTWPSAEDTALDGIKALEERRQGRGFSAS